MSQSKLWYKNAVYEFGLVHYKYKLTKKKCMLYFTIIWGRGTLATTYQTIMSNDSLSNNSLVQCGVYKLN